MVSISGRDQIIALLSIHFVANLLKNQICKPKRKKERVPEIVFKEMYFKILKKNEEQWQTSSKSFPCDPFFYLGNQDNWIKMFLCQDLAKDKIDQRLLKYILYLSHLCTSFWVGLPNFKTRLFFHITFSISACVPCKENINFLQRVATKLSFILTRSNLRASITA